MSSVKSLVVLVGLGLVGAATGVGCSASTGVGFDDSEEAGTPASLPESGTHPGDGSVGGDTGLPPVDASADVHADATTDASYDGSTDAAVEAEAGPVDAGSDAGAEGAACATSGAIGKESCGLCGFHTRLCAASDPADPASPNVWQPWGFCQSEVEGGCVPGTTSSEACGKCGTRSRVCQVNCQYAVGACKNEPVNACTPGSVDYQPGLSCPVGGRSRTCEPTCTFGDFSACFVPGPPSLTVIPTVGAKATGQFTLAAAKTAPRLSVSTCPNATISSTTTPYQYVTLDNPSASTVKVSVYTGLSVNAGAAYIDTVVASYAGATEPATDPARQACLTGVNDTCSDPAADACVSSWGGLVGASAVTMAPNSKALVYVGAWSASGTGDYQLTARTETVAP